MEEKSFVEKIFGVKKSRKLKQINCPCHGNHAYECGSLNSYCSVSKDACKHFKNNKHPVEIKSCAFSLQ